MRTELDTLKDERRQLLAQMQRLPATPCEMARLDALNVKIATLEAQ